jgi:hypothetical protein
MSDVPDMIERVEAAIMKALEDHGESEFSGWHGEFPHIAILDGNFDLAKVARAAIEAMRMPHERGDSLDVIQAKRVWNAGIDAALASPPKE